MYATFLENLLSILLHGVISLPDATSYDKSYSGISKQILNVFISKELFRWRPSIFLEGGGGVGIS